MGLGLMESTEIIAPPEATPAKFDRSIAGILVGLLCVVLVELITGMVMRVNYTPAVQDAYVSTQQLPVWIRSCHYWGSSILIFGSLIALSLMVIEGWFRRFKAVWVGVVILFFGSFLSQVSGNLLPFDRHGVQSAVVEAGIARSAPVGGDAVAQFIMSGERFNEDTLSRWFAGHVFVFGIVTVLGALLVLFALIKSGVRPSRALPSIISVGTLVLGGAVRAPLGGMASGPDYQSFDARVSWYTWPLHGLLNLFNKLGSSLGWIGAIAIPSVFALLLFAAPLMGGREKLVRGSMAAFGLVFLIAGVFFGGSFAPLTGNRDPKVQVVENGGTDVAPSTIDAVLASRGKKAFSKYGCNNCHGTDGRKGTSGPTLTNIASRRGSDRDWYQKFIKSPTSVKPTSTMPPFAQVSNDELRAMAEFLISNN